MMLGKPFLEVVYCLLLSQALIGNMRTVVNGNEIFSFLMYFDEGFHFGSDVSIP